MFLTNQDLGEMIGHLAKAEADGSYPHLWVVLRSLTLDDLTMIKNVVAALSEELDEWYRKTVTS